MFIDLSVSCSPYLLKLKANLYCNQGILVYFLSVIYKPADTGHKLNVHKKFRKRPGRLLNVLCTFNLRPVSTGNIQFLPISSGFF